MEYKELMELQVKLMEDQLEVMDKQAASLQRLEGFAVFWFWLTIAGLLIPVLVFLAAVIFKFSLITWLLSRLAVGG